MSATPPISPVQARSSSKSQNPPSVTEPLESQPPLATAVPPLLGASETELTQWVQEQGQPAYRGRQLHGWIYQKGARSLSEITVFPKQWREALSDIQLVALNYTIAPRHRMVQ
jgi:23S rRNA (adenine2503-C2)-methyltransferase